MRFTKTCQLYNQDFSSLVTHMPHIKNNHIKESPEIVVRGEGELKWKLRNGD